MFKKFLMKTAMKSQLKDVPPEARQMMEDLMEKNPDLLMTIAKEVQEEMKKGKDQQAALMTVASRHQFELKKLMKHR